MTKQLSARTVGELRDIFSEYDIDLPGNGAPTKKELLQELSEKGITNKTLRDWDNKTTADTEPMNEEEIETGHVVVFMNRNNPYFSWEGYQFSSIKRFLPMPKDDALRLIQTYEGFRIASGEEIKRYYK